MKRHIRHFLKKSDYQEFRNSANYVTPHASYIDEGGSINLEPYVPSENGKIVATCTAPSGAQILRGTIPNLKSMTVDGKLVDIKPVENVNTVLEFTADRIKFDETSEKYTHPIDWLYFGTAYSYVITPKDPNIKVTDIQSAALLFMQVNLTSINDLVTMGAITVDEAANSVILNTSMFMEETGGQSCPGIMFCNISDDGEVEFIDTIATIVGSSNVEKIVVNAEGFEGLSIIQQDSDVIFAYNSISEEYFIKNTPSESIFVCDEVIADTMYVGVFGYSSLMEAEFGVNCAVLPIAPISAFSGSNWGMMLDENTFGLNSEFWDIIGAEIFTIFEKSGICIWNVPEGDLTQMRILNTTQLHMSGSTEKTTIEIPSTAVTINAEAGSMGNYVMLNASPEYCYSGNTPIQVTAKTADGSNITSNAGMMLVLFNPEMEPGQALGIFNTFDNITESDNFTITSDSITLPFDVESSDLINQLGSSGLYILLIKSIDETTGEVVFVNTINIWEYSKLNLPRFETDGNHTVELELTTDSFYGGLGVNVSWDNIRLESIKTLESGAFAELTVNNIDLGAIQSVKESAFYWTNTPKIIIPDSCININSSAFYYSDIKTITIGKGITELAGDVFEYCDAEKIILPNTLKTITGSYAFYYCKKLKEVVVPDSVTTIGSYLIYNCPEVEHIYIGKSLVSDIKLYTSSVDQIAKIKTIVVNPQNTRYDSRDNCNCLIETASNKILYGGGLGFIPETVVAIGIDAFTSDYLQTIHIPASCTEITGSAFDCKNLIDITVAENNPVYYSDGDAIIEKSSNVLIKGCNSTIISENVTTIGEWAFSNCIFDREINVPNSVTTIQGYAFSNCTAPVIKLGTGLSSIEDRGFQSAKISTIYSYRTVAPGITSMTFEYMITGGTLYYPADSTGYDLWLSTEKEYLGYNNWTGVTM